MVSNCLKLGQKMIQPTMSAYFQSSVPGMLFILFYLLILLLEMTAPYLSACQYLPEL